MPYHDVILATSGLAGYWKLDDASGAAVDASGGGRNLSYSGSPTYGASPIIPGYNSTQFGGSVYASYGGVPITAEDNWTMECWCSMNVPGQLGLMYVGQDSGNGYGISLGSTYGAGSAMVCLFGGVNWGNPAYSFPGSSFVGHIVVTRRSGYTRAYVNGSNVGTPFGDVPEIPGGEMIVGRLGSANGMNFVGRLAHVAVYDVSLSDGNILAHYNAGLAAASVPIPVAYSSYRRRRA